MSDNLDSKTQPDLLRIARGLGLEPPNKAPRANLIRAIRDKRRSERYELLTGDSE